MAVSLAVGQIIELGIYCRCGPQLGINICHHEVNSLVGTPTDQELATYWDQVAFGTGLSFKYPAVLHNQASYRGVSVTIIQPTRQITQYFEHTVAGNSGANALPLQVSGLIKKVGDLPGRHGRGRIYLPFPSFETSTPDASGYPSPTGGYLTDAGFIGTALCTPVAGGVVGAGSVDMTPLIFNRDLPGASVTVGGFVVRPLWATQRRRGEAGRPNPTPF